MLAHLKEVKKELDNTVALIGEGGLSLSIMGPGAELDKLRDVFGPIGTKFYVLDNKALIFSKTAELMTDSHVTIVPFFTGPEGKMDEFKACFADF